MKIYRPFLKVCLCVLIALFGCVATIILPFRLPYAIDAGCVGVGFIGVGYLFKSHKQLAEQIFSLKLYEFILISIITLISIIFAGYINMRTGTYSIVPLFWVNAILSIVLCLNISKFIEKKIDKKFWKWISYIGKNSIVYLCLNQLTILLFAKLFNMIAFNILAISNISKLILTLVTLHIVNKILVNSKLKCTLGK